MTDYGVTRGETYRLILIVFTELVGLRQVIIRARTATMDLMQNADLVILARPGEPGVTVKDRFEPSYQGLEWSEVARLMRSHTARVVGV